MGVGFLTSHVGRAGSKLVSSNKSSQSTSATTGRSSSRILAWSFCSFFVGFFSVFCGAFVALVALLTVAFLAGFFFFFGAGSAGAGAGARALGVAAMGAGGRLRDARLARRRAMASSSPSAMGSSNILNLRSEYLNHSVWASRRAT